MTPAVVRRLQDLRHELIDTHAERDDKVLTEPAREAAA